MAVCTYLPTCFTANNTTLSKSWSVQAENKTQYKFNERRQNVFTKLILQCSFSKLVMRIRAGTAGWVCLKGTQLPHFPRPPFFENPAPWLAGNVTHTPSPQPMIVSLKSWPSAPRIGPFRHRIFSSWTEVAHFAVLFSVTLRITVPSANITLLGPFHTTGESESAKVDYIGQKRCENFQLRRFSVSKLIRTLSDATSNASMRFA